MNFTVIGEEEFIKFSHNHPLITFMQTTNVGKLREKNGWNVEYVGLKHQNKLIAATMLLSKKRHFNKYEFYAIRGPLLDYHNEEILTYFMEELKKYVKEHNGYVLRIDPYLMYKERDGSGNLVPNGINNEFVVQNLFKLGFHKLKKEKEEQVSWMYVLDIEGKNEEEIFKNFTSSTRNNIRKTLKNGIEIKELSRDELDQFYNIMLETGKRKEFDVRDLDYYQRMYDAFHDSNEIKFLVTSLDLSKHIELLEEEKRENQTKLDNLSSAKYNEGKRKNILNDINSLEKRINKVKKIKEQDGEKITLSGSMFVMTQPEVVYLSSGNYSKYMMFNSQYLIQWEMIKYAIEHGYKRYNFYGIPDNFDKNDKDYGIYAFKTGFNGCVEQLIGEYVLPTSIFYYVIEMIHKIRSK